MGAGMMCYMDRTFCVSEKCENKCGRKLTKEIRKAAKKWWGSDDAPICVGKFCEDKNAG